MLSSQAQAACFATLTVPVLPGAGSPPRLGLVAAFGVMAAAPLVVRRRWPALVVLVVTAVYVAAALADVAFTPFVSNAGPTWPSRSSLRPTAPPGGGR
ncbi:MAG TPA: hypothetical protein VF223_16455 [Trebonia sp.]